MNQPTREEFEAFKAEIREEVKRIEQKTEEIKTVKVEVASKDVLDRLDALEAGQQSIKQDIAALHDGLVKTVEDSANELRDTLASKEDIAGLATKDDLAAMEERFKDLLIKHLRPGGNGH